MASYATILSGLLLIGSSAHAQSVQVARSLPGFQCNALVHVRMARVLCLPLFRNSLGRSSHPRRGGGIAMSTVIVDDPPKTAEVEPAS